MEIKVKALNGEFYLLSFDPETETIPDLKIKLEKEIHQAWMGMQFLTLKEDEDGNSEMIEVKHVEDLRDGSLLHLFCEEGWLRFEVVTSNRTVLFENAYDPDINCEASSAEIRVERRYKSGVSTALPSLSFYWCHYTNTFFLESDIRKLNYAYSSYEMYTYRTKYDDFREMVKHIPFVQSLNENDTQRLLTSWYHLPHRERRDEC